MIEQNGIGQSPPRDGGGRPVLGGGGSAGAGRLPGIRDAIEGAVASVFGIGLGELRRATRGCARAAFARQVAMYLAHVTLRMTYTEVGRMFARDRTTVAYGCGVVEDRRDDPCFDRAMELLELAVPALLAGGEPGRPRGCR